jgi:hypothetical protein
LNGSASIPVAKATIFTPAPGASVVLSTKLADGRSAVITITKGAVAVTQPGGGQATRIALIGEPRAKCPVSHALNSAFRPAMPNWGFRSHGRGHPTVVHGKITLGFKGTQVLVQDQCRVRHGVDQFKIHVLSGSVDVRRGTKLLMTLHSARHGFFHTRGPSAEATVRG